MTKWLLIMGAAALVLFFTFVFYTKRESFLYASPKAIKRVVSLAPSMTETMIALNLAHLLVGVTAYCAGIKVEGVPKIGSFAEPNFEAIMAKKPDLVLGVPHVMATKVLEKIAESGVFVFAKQPDELSDIKDIVTSLALKFSVVDQGEQVNAEIDRAIRLAKDAFLEFAGKANRHEVLIVVATSPFVVAGKKTFASQIIEAMGLDNQAAKTSSWPVWPLEKLITDPPAFIILMSGEDALPAFKTLIASLGMDLLKSRIKLVVPKEPIFNSPSPAVIKDIHTITNLIFLES